MKRLLVPLILILAIQAWPVLAQDSPSLSNLKISLWPEFDQPYVLVIYRGVFTSETPLPVPVEIRIPARVGQPSALAYESEGQLLTQEYISRVEGEWRIVAFELPTRAFQLEYYDDQLSLQPGGRREYTYSFQPDYPVVALSFEAQVPPNAEAFALEPAADSVAAGDYGLDYHMVEMRNVEPDTELAWTVTYDRADSVLTQDILFPEASEPTQAPEPTQALVQDSPSLSIMEISLWPEFDRPYVLVIYRGVFTSETPLPVPVEIRIPARVGQPSALAYESEGQLLTQEYISRVEGEWRIVAFELPTRAFQLEYYDDQLSLQPGGRREYTYSLQPDYPVAALRFEAQVPPDAEAFALEPAADLIAAGDYGLDYHSVEMRDVEPGSELAWTLTYDKATSILTQDILFPEGSEPTQAPEATQAPATEDNRGTALIFLIGFVGLVAVGAVAFWLGQRAQPPPEPRAELRPGSEFCHTCGAPARR